MNYRPDSKLDEEYLSETLIKNFFAVLKFLREVFCQFSLFGYKLITNCTTLNHDAVRYII